MSVIHTSGIRASDRPGRQPVLAQDSPTGSTRSDTWATPRLMERIELLPRRDRAIVELTLRAGLSRADIARAMNMSAGAVSRRFRSLYARLHDPLVAALFDPRCPLAAEYRQLAIEHFLQGVSAPALADEHQLPTEQVRKMLAHVRWWHRGINAGRSGQASVERRA